MSENESYLHLYSKEYHSHHLLWARADSRIFRHYRNQYFKLIEPHEGLRVLELGCSSGKTTRNLAEAGCTVVSVDFDSNAIELAKDWLSQSPAKDRVQFICRSADQVEIRKSTFDKITMLDFVEHVPDKLLESIFKNIRESDFDGTVCIYTPHAHHWTELLRRWGIMHQDPTHINLKTLSQWKSFFEKRGLQIQKITRTTSHWPLLAWTETLLKSVPILGSLFTRSIAVRATVKR